MLRLELRKMRSWADSIWISLPTAGVTESTPTSILLEGAVKVAETLEKPCVPRILLPNTTFLMRLVELSPT